LNAASINWVLFGVKKILISKSTGNQKFMNCLYRLLFSFLHIGFLTSIATFTSFSHATSVQQLEKECFERKYSSCTLLGIKNLFGDNFRQLGSKEIFGDSVRQDGSRALNLFEKACEGGDAGGCYFLGAMYEQGEIVRQNKFRALELYQSSCDGGEALGCISIGTMYEKGEGVRQDSSKALASYGKACDLKEEDGCKNYAALKNRGIK
jgi:TPR repeat protein